MYGISRASRLSVGEGAANLPTLLLIIETRGGIAVIAGRKAPRPRAALTRPARHTGRAGMYRRGSPAGTDA